VKSVIHFLGAFAAVATILLGLSLGLEMLVPSFDPERTAFFSFFVLTFVIPVVFLLMLAVWLARRPGDQRYL
jgi:cell division protein FtsX